MPPYPDACIHCSEIDLFDITVNKVEIIMVSMDIRNRRKEVSRFLNVALLLLVTVLLISVPREAFT